MSAQNRAFVLILALVIQLPLLGVGVDLADTGFYMTFYQNIFHAPASVEYNFMYWLSGVAGGLWHGLWPGLLSMRVLGILENLACVYFLTRVFLNWKIMSLAVAMVLFGYYGGPATFYYDTLTAVLTVCGLALSLRSGGASGNRRLLYALAGGVVLGVNVFSRLTNLAGLGYVLLFLPRIRREWREALCWTAGWIAGVCMMLALMAAMGHWDIFLSNLRDIRHIALSSEATHGLGNMLRAQFVAWLPILRMALKLTGLWVVYRFVTFRRRSAVAFYLCCIPIAVCLAWFLLRADPTVSCGAVAVIGLAGLLFDSKDRKMRSAAWAGLLMMLIMPIGSDGGIMNNGTYAMWLALPCALSYFAGKYNTGKPWAAYGLRATVIGVVIFCVGCVVRMIGQGVYFDDTRMSEPMERVAGVLTARRRAEVINPLVDEVRMRVREGETLLVYGGAPGINYLTATLPAMGNSWPEQFDAEALASHLDRVRPGTPVLMMKFDTYGPHFGKPDTGYMNGLSGTNGYHTLRKSRIMLDWLNMHGYHPVWESPYAVLYRPRR